ncbi:MULTISPECIES: hypothetical protein [Bacillus]|uniref:Uncharacterized protein n=1 Tax=Bacillus glycinifermentans TaxID=1664069 RepID=A0AAJ3Z0M0_9BACI|nr:MULTISPECIES: hypothetical protein [Bacillus]MDU0070057.1 hypothetical protein [Bacillus sp. IG6]MED8017730.1 hypothetical protein [Bacillus glycinifermentans]QAT66393.1 hypothetical protein EQZ20_16800 [Bacillus glycinifermentans]
MRGLNVLKGILVALGGAFWVGYLWVYRPEIEEYSLIIGITMSTVFMVLVKSFFLKTILFILCGSGLLLYLDMFMLGDVRRLIAMLLVAAPMASAALLHLAEQASEEEGEM